MADAGRANLDTMIKNTQSRGCEQMAEISTPDPVCLSDVEGSANSAATASDLSDAQLTPYANLVVYTAQQSIFADCAQKNPGSTPIDYARAAACFQATFRGTFGDRANQGVRIAVNSDLLTGPRFLAWGAGQVKAGRMTAAMARDILTKNMGIPSELTEGISADDRPTRLAAITLYYQAMRLINSENMTEENARIIATGINAQLREDKTNALKLYVASVDADNFEVSLKYGPVALYDTEALGLGKDAKLTPRNEYTLTRLLFEAMYDFHAKAGKDADPENVATKLAAAVGEALTAKREADKAARGEAENGKREEGKDKKADAADKPAAPPPSPPAPAEKPDELYEMLKSSHAFATVEDGNLSAITFTDIMLRSEEKSTVPQELRDELGIDHNDIESNLAQALGMFWYDGDGENTVEKKYAKLGATKQKKFVETLIAAIQANYPINNKEVLARFLALTKIDIADDGSVTTSLPPASLYIRFENGYNDINIYAKLGELYGQAMEAKQPAKAESEEGKKADGDESKAAPADGAAAPAKPTEEPKPADHSVAVASAVADRVWQFLTFEDFAGLAPGADGTAFRDPTEAVRSFMGVRFQGFDEDGTMKPLKNPAMSQTEIEFDDGSKFSFTVACEAGKFGGEGVRKDGGHLMCVPAMKGSVELPKPLTLNWQVSAIIARFPDQIAPASQTDSFQFDPEDKAILSKIDQAWLRLGTLWSGGDQNVGITGGLAVNKRPVLPPTLDGIDSSAMGPGSQQTVQSSKTPGLVLDGTFKPLDEQDLIVTWRGGLNAAQGGLAFSNAAEDPASDEQHFYSRGGRVTHVSFMAEYMPIKDTLVFGAWGGLQYGGGDEDDPASADGLSVEILGGGAAWLFGAGSQQKVTFETRFTFADDDRRDNSSEEHAYGVRYSGPWHKWSQVDLLGEGSLNYFNNEGDITVGSGGDTTGSGLSGFGGSGDKSFGVPEMGISPYRQAVEATARLRFQLHNILLGKGLYLQQGITYFQAEQGTPDNTDGMEPGWAFITGFGLY